MKRLMHYQNSEYIRYTLDVKTKKLTYQITDWVIRCSGEECTNGTVYTTDGYGFLCMPRSITERLIEHNYILEEADAWLDLWLSLGIKGQKQCVFFFLRRQSSLANTCCTDFGNTRQTLGLGKDKGMAISAKI